MERGVSLPTPDEGDAARPFDGLIDADDFDLAISFGQHAESLASIHLEIDFAINDVAFAWTKPGFHPFATSKGIEDAFGGRVEVAFEFEDFG